MPFEVYRTTAEDLIGATDAALQVLTGVDEAIVADFLDVPIDNARNALSMGLQLGLLSQDAAGLYIPEFPYSTYLITGNLEQKAAILRLLLEEYRPYKDFKYRLTIASEAGVAAGQIRALHQMASHRGDILSTFVSLGTYTNSLEVEGGGRYRPALGDNAEFIKLVDSVISDRQSAEAAVRRKLGSQAHGWIDPQDVLDPFITAYHLLRYVENDPRSPILHAGNAVESFLVHVANHHSVNIQNAYGINAKADRISQAGNLSTKHKFMVKYLGHVRNSTDHGIDQEIGVAWSITPSTSIEYVHVALSTVRAIVAALNNQFII